MYMNKFFILLFTAFLSNSVSATPGDTITLDLSKPLNPASFNYTSAGYWTETYNDEDYTFIDFENFSFSHLIDGEGASWGGSYWDGFTVCTDGDNSNYGQGGSSNWISHQWGNMAGGGIKTFSNTAVTEVQQGIPYLLGYCSTMAMERPCQIILSGAEAPYEAVGVFINASPWPYYGNIEGDGFARPLNQEGDYFKLFIRGLNENYEDNGKAVEYCLARYENGELTQSPDWEYVDLSALGEVYGFYCTMASSDSDPVWGMNTAAYFCMDKLQVRVPDEMTGIAETQGIASIQVYPNPFTDYVVINATENGTATICDLSGKVLLNTALKADKNTLNTSSLTKGIYILRSGSNITKIIK
jgi:hypothetical protein